MTVQTGQARVKDVESLEDFKLRLTFSDGSAKEIDLDKELWGPVFEPLRKDPALFRQVRVDEELGNIVWPSGADLDPDVLYGDHKAA